MVFIIIGIDIGGTTTDAIALVDGKIEALISVEAGDPITAAAGALGKMIETLGVSLDEVRYIAATGVGTGHLGTRLLGIPLMKVDEFTSIGTAGAYLTGINRSIVVSMGTGTALVRVDGDSISHWGGTGVGGGTLLGLSKLILNISTISILAKKAEHGSLDHIDLTVGDISGGPLNGLPASATASNFGKVADDADEADKALALINLVCQTIGVMAMFAARANGFKDIILTGKLTSIPQVKDVIEGVGKLFDVRFHIPRHADYATAIGAAIHLYNKERK